MNTKVKRFELVELTVANGATGKVNFNTIPQLRNQPGQTIVIRDITVYPASSYLNSQVTNSIPGFPDSEIAKCVLVLYVNGEESIKMIPLAQLIHVSNATNPFQDQISSFDDLTNVDFDKSYVQFSAASSGLYVIPFGVNYIRIVNENLSQIPYNI